MLFYNGNTIGKIWHTFSLGHKKTKKVLFYNGNSTGEIWHAFSCSWRKRKEHVAVLAKNRKNRLDAKNLKKCYFIMGIHQVKSGIHFLVFEERERKMKPF